MNRQEVQLDRYGRNIQPSSEEIMILTGGKDKSLKLWRLKRREDGEIRRDNLNGQRTSLIQADLVGFSSNLNQINCIL